jgi:acetyl esterase/lipase
MSTIAAGLLFLLSLLGLYGAVNALRPPSRRGPWWLQPRWLSAMLTAELVPLRLSIHAVLVVLLIWVGALEHPVGVLGLVITIVTWLGYAVLQIRSWRTKRVMADALEHAGIDARGFAEVETALVALGYPYRVPPQLERIEDIEYAPGLHLDVYRRADATSPGPALLQVHGGSWTGGHRRQQARPLLHRMAAKGWTSVAVSYPLAPEAQFPEQLIALKRAVCWVRDEGPEHGIDPGFIAVTGGSAGGHLAALVALTSGDQRYQPGFENADTSVHAAATLYGVYDFLNRHQVRENWWGIFQRLMGAHPEEAEERYREASPLDRVGADAPPFFVIHGTHDGLVPAAESELFVDALLAVSHRPVLYAEVPGANHGFDVVHSFRTHYVVSAIARFLEAARAGLLDEQPAAEQPSES